MFHFGEFELYSSNNGNPVLAPLSSEEIAWDADDLDETLGEATLWLEDEIDRELIAGKGPRLRGAEGRRGMAGASSPSASSAPYRASRQSRPPTPPTCSASPARGSANYAKAASS